LPPQNVPTAAVPSSTVPSSKVQPSEVRPREVPPRIEPVHLVPTTPPQAASVPPAEPSAPAAKVTSPLSRPIPPASSNSTTLIFVSAAAIVLVAATFFFTRKHYAPPVTTAPSAASAPVAPAPAVSAPAASAPASAPTASAPSVSAPGAEALGTEAGAEAAGAETAGAGKVTLKVSPKDQPPAESGRILGTLIVVAGQDDARVFLNGELQRQLTQAGQLRLPNLELKDYVVQVSKSGFQDPPQQKIGIRKGEESRLIFHLQPQPRLASLTIQGGAPGTTVLVDQTLVGTIQRDGTLSVTTVDPGDHTVELRND